MLSPASPLLIWASDKIKTGQLLLSDAADPLAFSSSDKGDRLRIYCLQQVALYTTEKSELAQFVMPLFQGLIQMVFRECAVTLSCLPIPYSSSCYSLQEIKPWGGSRILFQGINYQQWWNFLCRLHNAFYKRLTTAFGNKPHKNTNCTMAVQGKSLILTFPRFSWSRIIRVYCSLKEA